MMTFPAKARHASGFIRRVLLLILPLTACGQQPDDPLPVSRLVLAQPCDIREGCVAEADDLSVMLSMGPEVRALTPFPVDVEIQRGASVASMTVSFGMQGMDMGLNRYGLIKSGEDLWHASVTLPICMSGRSDWIADFELLTKQRRYRLQVPFVLQK